MKNPLLKAFLFLVITLLLGYGVAGQINGFLGISFNDKPLPSEGVPEAPSPTAVSELPPITTISLPPDADTDDRFTYAVAALQESVASRNGRSPAIVAPDAVHQGRAIHVRVDAETVEQSQGFIIRRQDAETLTVTGGSRLGAVYGIYRLVDAILAGEDPFVAFVEETAVSSTLPYRFTEIGAVGVLPNPEAWRSGDDYSHHSRAFQDVILAQEPYVDPAAMARVEAEFQTFVHRIIGYGYNGIIVNGFLEYVNFDQIGDGYAVYGPDSPYRQRHLAMRQEFGRMLQYAHDMGLQVIMKTDMLALTEPLEAYLEAEVGGIDATDPALWAFYQAGMDEFFTALPFVDGVMIRIGEAGAIYNLEGWNYYSSLHVRSKEAVQMMLRTFTDVAAVHGKTIFFRTWSVGVGDVGDMHTNPDTYARVLDGLTMPNLVISTKYTMGDFDSYLPLNPTLRSGRQARIIEFQARREFEAFNAFPNYMGPLHQAALQDFRRHNPHIAGIWLWTQDGGPWRAGPMSLYPFHGFWHLIDANAYATGRLAWEPDADIAALTEAWVRRTFSRDPETVRVLTELMLASRDPVLHGLYIGPYAEQQVLALGLEPPPMMWIFKWDIVSGANSALSAIYFTSREQVDTAVAEGFQAVAMVEAMQADLAAVDRDTFIQPELYDKLGASLAYEADLLETLAWYRQGFLSYYHWLDTGETAVYDQWQSTHEQYRQARDAHLAAYDGNLDFPPYNFFAAAAGMAHAVRSNAMRWLGRGLLGAAVLLLAVGSGVGQRLLPPFPGRAGLRALWLALVSPWRLGSVTAVTTADRLAVSLLPLLIVVLGRLAFSSFLSIGYAILILVPLAVFIGVLLALFRGRDRFYLWAAIGAPLLLKNMLLLGVTAVRGPVRYWYLFWTDEGFRSLYLTLSVAAFAWIFFVLYAAGRAVYRRSGWRVAGSLLLATGAPLLVLGGLVYGIGLETAVTAFNDEMAILPLGLSRILGITTHLDIPSNLAVITAVAGMTLALVGAGGWLAGRRSEAE